MKNPLRKRIWRQIVQERGRYIATGLILSLLTGFVAGGIINGQTTFDSLEKATASQNVESGHFILKEKASESFIQDVEAGYPADLETYVFSKAEERFDEEAETQLAGIPSSMKEQLKKELHEQAEEEISKEVKTQTETLEEELDLDAGSYPIPVTLIPDFFKEAREGEKTTVRIYSDWNSVNRPELLEGKWPEAEDEVLLTKIHADQVNLHTGDDVLINNHTFKVTGLISQVAYTTLHEKNTDFMFSNDQFDVAFMTEEGFDSVNADVHYGYAWKWDRSPSDEMEEKEMSDSFFRVLSSQAVMHEEELEDYLPAYLNQAIHFAPGDIEGDTTMYIVLLEIVIVILGFILAMGVAASIRKESKVIGTLMASGYSRSQLFFHYMLPPILVMLAAAAAGNLLGYFFFFDLMRSLYLHSYSLPSAGPVFSWNVLLLTTVIPILLMIVIHACVLWLLLRRPIQLFLRQETVFSSGRPLKKLVKGSFMSRFRKRLILQNVSIYAVLVCGLVLVGIILSLAICIPETLDETQETITESLLAPYQTFVKEDAEVLDGQGFNRTSMILPDTAIQEEISIYGLQEDGPVPVSREGVVISRALADKYGYGEGDDIVLREKYSSLTRTFHVTGVTDRTFSMDLYMPVSSFNQMFDHKDEYDGYFSSEPLDLPEEDVIMTLDKDDYLKMAIQLNHSMGSVFDVVSVICVLFAGILISLISRIVTQKNQTSISMLRVLGFREKEISRLFVSATLVVVAAGSAFAAMIGPQVLEVVWRYMMMDYSGWFTLSVSWQSMLLIFLCLTAGFLVSILFDMRRIRKIPLSLALKSDA